MDSAYEESEQMFIHPSLRHVSTDCGSGFQLRNPSKLAWGSANQLRWSALNSCPISPHTPSVWEVIFLRDVVTCTGYFTIKPKAAVTFLFHICEGSVSNVTQRSTILTEALRDFPQCSSWNLFSFSFRLGFLAVAIGTPTAVLRYSSQTDRFIAGFDNAFKIDSIPVIICECQHVKQIKPGLKNRTLYCNKAQTVGQIAGCALLYLVL